MVLFFGTRVQRAKSNVCSSTPDGPFGSRTEKEPSYHKDRTVFPVGRFRKIRWRYEPFRDPTQNSCRAGNVGA